MGEAKQPNILFIMADQHRFDYLGCAGASWLRTPNLDRLAARGVRFSNCFSNSPVCAPARIALATGLQPHKLGALDNHAYLPVLTHRTYYQRLRDVGYWVACVGKLDLAKPNAFNGTQGNRPAAFAWGFTHPLECEGKMHAGRCAERAHGPYSSHLETLGLREKFAAEYAARGRAGWLDHPADSILPTEAFEDCFIGRKAAEWIADVPDEFPWHMFVSFVGPHNPFDPPKEYADRCRKAAVPPPVEDALEGKPAWHRDRQKRKLDRETVRASRRQYCAAIEAIDDQIGAVLAAVERRGWSDHTYVFFSSDHGEMLGDHGMWTKGVMYEPALHVPLIAAGPGLAGGRVSDALIELIDLNPTICDLAGLPPQEGTDALSFRAVLEGGAAEHRPDVFSTLRNCLCLRDKRYKAVRNYNDLSELYDLQEDPHELKNLAAQRSAECETMLRRAIARSLEAEWRW